MQNMVSQFLPDGRRFLFYTAGAAPDGMHPVNVASLDTLVTRSLLMANSRPQSPVYVWLFGEKQGRRTTARY